MICPLYSKNKYGFLAYFVDIELYLEDAQKAKRQINTRLQIKQRTNQLSFSNSSS